MSATCKHKENDQQIIALTRGHNTVWCSRCGAYQVNAVIFDAGGNRKVLEGPWNIPINDFDEPEER